MTDRILRLPDVLRMTGYTRASFYRLLAGGHAAVGVPPFPTARRLSARSRGWLESEIAGWLAAVPRVANDDDVELSKAS